MTATTTPTAAGFIGPEGVCELVPGMTKTILSQMRFKSTGPRYYKPSPKTVVYKLDDVLEWIESTARTGTAEGV